MVERVRCATEGRSEQIMLPPVLPWARGPNRTLTPSSAGGRDAGYETVERAAATAILHGQASVAPCAEGDEICPIPGPASAVPAGTWADSKINTFEPSRWAIGALSESEIDRLPAAAQAVLSGAERATYNNVFLLYPDHPDRHRPAESLELTTAEVSTLRAALVEAGIPELSSPQAAANGGRTSFVAPNWFNLGDLDLHLFPIFPHGEPIAFLG
jgi:hypothetical protein